MVGLNPLHAMFPADPNHNSPYSPGNPALLNTLNIDVGGLPELETLRRGARSWSPATDFQQRLQACREAPLVDYAAVSDLKMPVLELLFQSARSGSSGQRWDAFLLFQREMDEALVRQATFDALHEHFFKGQGKWMWQEWPKDFRDPEGEAVARFREEQCRADRVLPVAAMDGRRPVGEAAAHRARTSRHAGRLLPRSGGRRRPRRGRDVGNARRR